MLDKFLRKSATTPTDFPPKEEAVNETPTDINVEEFAGRLVENPEEAVLEEADRLFNEWNEVRQRAGLYFFEPQAELWKLRGEAVELARQYGENRSPDVLDELKQKLTEMNAGGAAIGEAVHAHAQEAPASPVETESETAAADPFTPAEVRDQLGSAVRGFEQEKRESEKLKSVREALSPFKTAAETAELAYLAEYKNYQATKKLGQKEPESLRTLESQYYAARLQYAGQLDASVDTRIKENIAAELEQRPELADSWVQGELRRELRAKAEQEPSFQALGTEEKEAELARRVEEEYRTFTPEARDLYLGRREDRLRARHRRIIRFKEIERPAAEAKTRTLKEAQSLRNKGIIRRSLGFLATRNRELENKHGKWKVTLAKAGLTTAVLGLGGAASAAGAVALAGWGTFRVLKVLAGTAAGAAVGEGAAALYEHAFGRKKLAKAEDALRNAGRSSDELDVETLRAIDELRMKLLKNADENTLERDKAIVRAVATALVAGSTSAGLSLLEQPVTGIGTSGTLEGQAQSPEVGGADQGATEAPGGTAAEPSPARPEVTLSVEESPTIAQGEGADTLFYELKSQLQARYGNTSDVPAIRAVLENDPRAFSRSFGFADETSSRLMNVGDHLRIKDNELVFFDKSSGQDITLIDRNGQVPVGTFEKIHTNMLPDAVPPAAVVESAPTPETLPVSNIPAAPEIVPPPLQPEVLEPAPSLPPVEAVPPPAPITPVEPVPQSPAEAAPQAPVQVPEPSYEPVIDTEQEVPSSAQEAPETSPQPEIPVNPNGVPINASEVHLYGAPDPNAPGGEVLIAYGGEGMSREASFARLQEIARANPGKQIYFQSPAETTINGRPQAWIASGTYTPNTGFTAIVTPDPSRPELVGVRINPQIFTRIVN